MQILLTRDRRKSGFDFIIHFKKLLLVSYPQLKFLAYINNLAFNRLEAFSIEDFLASLFLNIYKKALDL